MSNFWTSLKRPARLLAPMAGITDRVFRQLVHRFASPDACFTEFVSASGLCSPGREALLDDLEFAENERPIVAQLFGADPEHMRRAAACVAARGFDGIDVNMGCPDRSVEKQGAGAALMSQPELACRVLRAARDGADGLPVSVKTRIGYGRNEIETWIRRLLDEEPAAITIHARTRQQRYRPPTDWSAVADAVAIAAACRPETVIVGNGDLRNADDVQRVVDMTGVAGVMVGRAVIGHPWWFADRAAEQETVLLRLQVLVEHARLFDAMYGERRRFCTLNKHFYAYASGFPGAKALRQILMRTVNAEAVAEAVEGFAAEHGLRWVPLTPQVARGAAAPEDRTAPNQGS